MPNSDFCITFKDGQPVAAKRLPDGVSYGIRHYNDAIAVVISATSLLAAVTEATSLLSDGDNP